MRCPACQCDTPSGAKFCPECGTSVVRRCPGCGAEHAPAARFCIECGVPLDSVPPTTAPPPPRGEAIVAGSASGAPEHRLVTVMFCDLADSTELSTRLDPEDYRDAISSYHQAASDLIVEFGGFVAKYMGDGIVAYFGYPLAAEDDAERAVRAGLATCAAVAALRTQAGALQTRVGLASGRVIIGDLIGEGAAREQAIAGEVPNLAARLQGLAPRGGVVMSRSTQALVGGLFDSEAMGEHELKGFDKPQAAWLIRGENVEVSRFQALRSASTPFVGRDAEIDLLLRAWRRAEEGDPQLILISADAGVGKSRITAVLEERIRDRGALLSGAYCAPSGRDSPFQPLLRVLEIACGFVSTDTAETRAQKLKMLLVEIYGDREHLAGAIFAALLSLSPDNFRPIDLSPQRQREEAVKAFATLIRHRARAKPMLFVFEDAHWIDPSSLDVIRAISHDTGARLTLLLVMTYRPEFVPPQEWLGEPNVTSLSLPRLRRADAEAMIQTLAGEDGLSSETQKQILRHAEGNPLYIEEITRAVLDAPNWRGASEGDLAVPPTLQASLLARLDRLGEAKQIAQVGAAIGREFSRSLLGAVVEENETDLDATLVRLVEADVIYPSVDGGEVGYIFKHALIQDTAYGALLRSARRTLHGRIADALSTQFAVEADAKPELLARHLSLSQRPAEAVPVWRKAAVRSIRGGAWRESLHLLEAALEDVARLPDGEMRDRLEIDVQMMLGGVSQCVVGHSAPSAAGAYDRVWMLANRLGDTFHASLAAARAYIRPYGQGDLEGALASGVAALASIEAKANRQERAIIEATIATPFCFMGRFTDVVQTYRQYADLIDDSASIVIPEEYFYMPPQAQLLAAIDFVSVAMAEWDLYAAARRTLLGGIRSYGPLGAIISLTVMIYAEYLRQDRELCLSDATAMAQAISEVEGAGYYTELVRLIRANVAVAKGDHAAVCEIGDIMNGVSTAFAKQHLPRYQLIAGDALAMAGDIDGARHHLAEALKGGPFGSQQCLRAEVLRRLGEICEQSDEAEHWLRQARQTATDQAARLFELRATVSLARVLTDQGRGAEAMALLEQTCGGDWQPFGELEAARAMLKTLRHAA